MKVNIFFIVLVVILSLPAYASLEISVVTDKEVYQLGETVEVYVSLYNPTPDPVTLTYGSSLVATYLMDQSYYWHTNVIALDVILHKTIQPDQTLMWQLDHEEHHQAYYPLGVGYHSVQGGSMAWQLNGQLSEPFEFQVVPEPTTLSLLSLGAVLLKRKR